MRNIRQRVELCHALGRLVSLGLLGLVSSLFNSAAWAVDFKIDLPVQVKGSETQLPSAQSVRASFAETEGADGETLAPASAPEFGFLIPEMPSNLQSVQENPATVAEPRGKGRSHRTEEADFGEAAAWPRGGIYETGAFPVPACLEANVAFWKKIYREIEVNEALIHDRDDLARVFGKVTLPYGAKQRTSSIRAARQYMEEQLQELAQNMERGRPLGADEQSLLAVFKPADQNPQSVREAASRIRVQSGLKSRFDAGVMRSLEYLPTITTILANARVPKDIVHLPHVESSYVRTAQSKVGAMGLWQLMPGTMRMLKGRHAVARRTEVVLSTQAAAELLQQNYRLLGSWPLALTAYNHGPAGVSRAVRKTGSRDLCTIIERYQSPSFRFASSNFYAQFLAARHVALDKYQMLSNSSAHGRMLQPLLAHAMREKL